MKENTELWNEQSIIEQCELLTDSFFHWTNKPLLDQTPSDPVQKAFLLYHAPFVLVSHGIEADPVFNFANLKAQELWKLPWKDFTKMPSRLSAEPMERSEREKLLKQANEKGFISNYTGIRISSKEERFLIKDTILWNVIDKEGNYRGQATVFSDWEYLNL